MLRVVLLWILLVLISSPQQVQAQETQYRVSTGTLAAYQGDLPFWLVANHFGTVDRRPANFYLRGSVMKQLNSKRYFDWGYGLEALGRLSEHNTLHVHQWYGTLKLGPFNMTAGQWQRSLGVRDPFLSTGGLVMGENAAPFPGIEISMPVFVGIPGTQEFLQFRGHLGHGWLESNRFVSGSLMHEKSFYLRIFPDHYPIQLQGGVIHAVMWGGEHPRFGRLPQSLKDYLRIFFVQEGGTDAPDNEIVNVLGNTVGAYDFSIWYHARAWEILLFRHFYIETGPSLRFRNPLDGQWGLSFRRKKEGYFLDAITWEHINMLRQGAQYSRGEARGPDNYYNNVLYQGGWTYRGRSIGLPLLFADGLRTGIINNMVLAHHIGAEGSLPLQIDYRVLATFSRNYGAALIFEAPGSNRVINGFTPRTDNLSLLLSLSMPFPSENRLVINTAIAADYGSLYPDNVGFFLGITWSANE